MQGLASLRHRSGFRIGDTAKAPVSPQTILTTACVPSRSCGAVPNGGPPQGHISTLLHAQYLHAVLRMPVVMAAPSPLLFAALIFRRAEPDLGQPAMRPAVRASDTSSDSKVVTFDICVNKGIIGQDHRTFSRPYRTGPRKTGGRGAISCQDGCVICRAVRHHAPLAACAKARMAAARTDRGGTDAGPGRDQLGDRPADTRENPTPAAAPERHFPPGVAAVAAFGQGGRLCQGTAPAPAPLRSAPRGRDNHRRRRPPKEVLPSRPPCRTCGWKNPIHCRTS